MPPRGGEYSPRAAGRARVGGGPDRGTGTWRGAGRGTARRVTRVRRSGALQAGGKRERGEEHGWARQGAG